MLSWAVKIPPNPKVLYNDLNMAQQHYIVHSTHILCKKEKLNLFYFIVSKDPIQEMYTQRENMAF